MLPLTYLSDIFLHQLCVELLFSLILVNLHSKREKLLFIARIPALYKITMFFTEEIKSAHEVTARFNMRFSVDRKNTQHLEFRVNLFAVSSIHIRDQLVSPIIEKWLFFLEIIIKFTF